MTGLEKIIDKINSDSKQLCSGIIANAQKKCDEITADAEKQGKELASEIESKAQADGKSIVSMAKSSAAQQSRQTLLKAKVEAVNDTLSKLGTFLSSLPPKEYFEAIIKLAAENAMKGECTASLSAADNSRLPADFALKLTAALKAKGAVCTVTDKPASIESGVFLDYGDIAVNCSFEAILEENSDIYKEKISEIIF